MRYISIDVGTYSIKFILSQVDKRRVIHESMTEVVIDTFKEQFAGEIDQNNIVNEIVISYLNETQLDAKTISQVPNNLISTRFLVIPIQNKRKAKMALPPISSAASHPDFSCCTHGCFGHAFIKYGAPFVGEVFQLETGHFLADKMFYGFDVRQIFCCH